MKRFILIRHAKTAGNTEGRYIGRKTDCGIEDKEAAASCFIEAHITGKASYFTGSMRRCRETANMLFPDKIFTVIDDLTEIDFGVFEGKNSAELTGDPDYAAWIESGGTLSFPKGESRDDFIKRSMACFYDISDRTADGETAVIICHGGNIMAIMSTLCGDDYYDYLSRNLEGYAIDTDLNGKSPVVHSYVRVGGGDRS